MRRVLFVWGLLLTGVLLCLGQSQAYWQSRSQVAISVTPAGFQGGGDIVSGAAAFWSLRAYTAATRGNKLLNACNSTGGVDVGCADLFSDATTGQLVPATVSGITCPGANCTVKTLYDLTGNTNCSGSACEIQNATVAARPTLVASCIGSLPCMQCLAANSPNLQSLNTTAQAQPFTVSAVARRTGAFTSLGTIWGAESGNPSEVYFNNTANALGIYAGAATVATAADSAMHAVQGVFNSTSSDTNVDGTPSIQDAGTNNISGGGFFHICEVGATGGHTYLTGDVVEVGIWYSAFSPTNSSNMSTNQHSATSGWNF